MHSHILSFSDTHAYTVISTFGNVAAKFKANNSKRLWDTMKTMTGMSSMNKPILTDIEPVFANGLNDIFSHFDPTYNPERYVDILKNTTYTREDRLVIIVDKVRKHFQLPTKEKPWVKEIGDSQDSFQFAYKAGRSKEDAVVTLVHF